MKPEGNMVAICTGMNEKPQRPIGYEEEAKAKSFGGALLESAGNTRSREAIDPIF